jgi:nitroreductase
MTETTLASRAGYLIEVAGRAPSLHNTQPWRFAVSRDAIELHADVSRRLSDQARDGVPAHAFPATPGREAGRLPQRDFDLGQGIGMLPGGGPAPRVTAVLLTPGDGERDWLRAGQALHRLLLRAASRWVFARLNTQPLEDTATRTRVRDCLMAPGSPQLLLELGVSRTAHPTARRPRHRPDLAERFPASPAPGPYRMNAAPIRLERHERGIHVV